MSSAWSTPALVLRRWNVGESALIVKLLTPTEGLLSARVPGAKSPTASLHFLSNPLTLAEVHIVPSRRGHMVQVVQATPLGSFSTLQESLPRLQAAALVLEIVEGASTEGLANPVLFLLTLDTLRQLELTPPEHLDLVLLAFVWQALDGLGAAPVLTRCIRTDSTEAGDFVVPLAAEGGFACAAAAQSFPPGARVPIDVLHLLHRLADELAKHESLPPDFHASLPLVHQTLAVMLHFVQHAIHADLKTARPWMQQAAFVPRP